MDDMSEALGNRGFPPALASLAAVISVSLPNPRRRRPCAGEFLSITLVSPELIC
jgi:hypothetical protein